MTRSIRAPASCSVALLILTASLGGCAPSESSDPAAEAGGAVDEPAATSPGPAWTITRQESGTDALLQAVSVVDPRTVWVSGHEGTWVRTGDGGGSWTAGGVAGAEELQFRDVDAFDPSTAYLMSAGDGDQSRIYRTEDGGSSWTLQYTADHPDAFLDCMAFWDAETGFAYGDAVDGSLFILRTEDGGTTWSRLPGEALPEAQEGEGGFAASGTCAVAADRGTGWIATGNAARARILRSGDRGLTWSALDPPVVGGASSGLTSIRVRGMRGLAVGGVIGGNDETGRYVTTSDDGGLTWTEGGSLAMAGPAYGSDLVVGLPVPAAVAVGPGGIDLSWDGGASWITIDERTHWAVTFAADGSGWAVGPSGRVTFLDLRRD